MSNATRNYTIRLSASGKQQLEADLRALGASGEKSLRRIQTATKPANTGLRETDRAARELKGSLGAVSAELPALARLARFMGTTALAGGIVAFGRSSLNVGREFQAMMQRVEAATRAGEAEMGRLSDAAKELGATTAFTAMQAAEAIEVLAKNGVSVADILDGALSSSVALASALGAEMAPAADLVTDLMQQFGLEAGQLPDIVDQVTGAALKSKFGFDDLRLAIGQAGGVAGTSGVEIEDFLTVLAATSSSFASGSDAGTSFKTFLQRLTPESKKAAAVMAELDLAFFDAQGNMKSMTEIAQILQDGLANLSEEARNDALKTVFGTDAIRTAAALAKQGAEGMRELAQGIGEVSAQEQAEVRLRGLDGALKEVAAAWEALQLEAAENGGLDVAESFVRRLTEALRFLTENFQEVEEIAERVAQALTVYLVGKGMTLAIAKGVALRAALIEIAGAATGVGTAASRAAGPLTRMGIAARALTGVLGGPLSLAITAGSLIALGIDTDAAADAVERAEAAALKASHALDEYQEASRRAAEEQGKLGGQVSEATRQMLAQSKAGLMQALDDAERTLKEARSRMSGELFDRNGFDDFAKRYQSLFRTNLQTGAPAAGAPANRYMTNLGNMAEQAAALEISASSFAEAFAKVQAVGPGIEQLAEDLRALLGSDAPLSETAAVEQMLRLADASGLFAEELEAIRATDGSETGLRQGYGALLEAMDEAIVAGRLVRSEQEEGFRENIKGLKEAEAAQDALQKRVSEVEQQMLDVQSQRPFDEAGDSAKGAADEIARLNRVYGQYQATRIAGDAQKGPSMQPWGEPTSSFSREGMDPAAIRALAVLEQASGKLFNILSDYRSPEENKAAGGAKHSQHMSGKAFDIDVSGMSIDERLELIKLARSVAGFGGVGVYSSSLHFDTGPERAWGPDYTSASVPGWAAETLGMYGKDSQGGSTKADELDKQAEALARVVSVGRDQLDQLRLEADLAGRSVEQQAQLTFQYEALKRAREAGIDPAKTTTEDGRILADVIDEQAAAYGRLVAAKDADARKSEETKEKNQELADEIATYKGEISALFDNLKPGGDGIAGFWDDLTSMILDKLWTLAFDPVWNYLAQLMQGMFSGLGGGSGLLSVGASALGIGGKADGGEIDGYAGGGALARPRRAAGQLTGTGGKRQDNLLFWGSSGEFMQPAAAVDFYGVEFMEAIRNRRLPKFATGGSLGGGAAPGRPGAFQFNQQIIDKVGVKVTSEEQTLPDGSRLQRLVLSEAVNEAMTTPGGAANRTLRRRGFTQPRPRR